MNKTLYCIAVALTTLSVLSMASCSGERSAVGTREVVGGIPMITIPAGSFRMGYDYASGPQGAETPSVYYPDEQPVHTVRVSAFRIGETEITQRRYEAVMGDNPSAFRGDDLPVTNLGATQALLFCNKLSEASGLEPCYDPGTGKVDFSKNGFRLPTEAEWEYACRAGTTTHFNTGDTAAVLDATGWYIKNSGGTSHPVAGKTPNAWGLYDMHGNVWEFCYDGFNDAYPFGDYPDEPVIDPKGHDNFNYRIMRGGGWFSEASECRSAVRGKFWTGGGCNYLGFRVAQSVVD